MYYNFTDYSRSIHFFLLLLMHAGLAQAQEKPAEAAPDSMLSYDLAEIVISDGTEPESESYTVHKIALADVSRENAVAVSDMVRLIPAAYIQTNSRGESLIYLRNAGERQVALFFNGALLNVPWDNRMNLDLVPASVIGGMTVAKGIPSTLYGTNVLGGAISITSRSLQNEGSMTEIGVQGGALGTSSVALTHLFSHKGLKFTGSAGYSNRNGVALPNDANLSFNQMDSEHRTNTDREMLNMFAQGSYQFNNGIEVGLSYLLLDGDFGIAPEGHINPEALTVRFWRYPHWQNETLVFNGRIPVGTAAVFRGAVWGSKFAQDISSYDTAGYDRLVEQQQDDDQTYGARLIWMQELGLGQLSLAVNLLTSDHEERTLEADEQGRIDPAPAIQPELYRQTVYSLGAEYSVPLADALRFTVGSSLDGITTPETGDKPASDPFRDIGLSTGLQLRLSDNTMLRAAAGRKVRFPTMRELFGVALNRFLLNPDLRPETSFVSEISVAQSGSSFTGEIIGFYHRTFDTIDQQNVEVDGLRLRQRINLEGSRVFGVEVVGRAMPNAFWDINGHLTAMNVRGLEEGSTFFLTEKPAWLGSLAVQHRRPSGISLLSQAVYTGKAFGRDESNELVSLSTSLVFDAKAAYLFRFGARPLYGEVFFRIDNIFDAAAYPQLGLPGPGRFISLGGSLSF